MRKLTEKAILRLEDPTEVEFRRTMTTEFFYIYIMCYKADAFQLAPADFHIELMNDLQGVEQFIAVMGFRGSAKSTILEAYAEWCLITKANEFIVWIGATDSDAKESVANIKASITENEILARDYEIDIEQKKSYLNDKWSEGQLTINGSTILTRSRGQKVRGKKYKNVRITKIIVDDLEDLKAVKTAEKRKETRTWFFAEVINATKQGVLGDDVKVVMLGNLVHRDCLLARLMEGDDVKVLRLPLFGGDGREIAENITWKGLYPDMKAIEKEKKKVMLAGKGEGHIIWQREYLLKLVDEETQIIKYEDIQYYDESWLQKPKIRGGVGVDLAISKKETADYTAMTKGVEVENDYGELRLLIMPNNVKQRLDFAETLRKAKDLSRIMPQGTIFYVEKVAYQQSAIEVFERNGLLVEPMAVTKDKRARLNAISNFIKTGMVLFPKEGADDIIEELVGFEIEEHDDQVDSLVHLIDGMMNSDTLFFA